MFRFALSAAAVLVFLSVASYGGMTPVSASAVCPSPVTSSFTLSSDCEGAIVVTASDVEINLGGHTVSPTPGSELTGVGITLDNVSGVHLHSGTITGFLTGVSLVNANGNHLNDLTVTDNVNGIVLSNSDGNLINGSFVNVNKGVGVWFLDSDNNKMATMEIIHNRGPRFPSGGVLMDNSNGNTLVSMVVLRDGEVGVHLVNSSGNKVQGLTIYGTNEQQDYGPGILLEGNLSDRNTVRSNLVGSYDPGFNSDGLPRTNSYGILLMAGADYNLVQSNQTIYNQIDGIAVQAGATNNTIKSNISILNLGFDLSDGNAACGTNKWAYNTFGDANLGCIH